MAEERFDPGGFYELDLARGRVMSRDGGAVVALPGDVVGALLGAVVEGDGPEAVAKLGARMGAVVERSLGGDAGIASPEAVASRVADVLGVCGWGRVVFERWGDGMAIRWADAPLSDAAAAPFLSGVVSALADEDTACVPVGGERFVVVDPSVAPTVAGWARDGADAAAVIGRLAAGEAA